jgi:hypothetical protein
MAIHGFEIELYLAGEAMIKATSARYYADARAGGRSVV